MKFLKISFLVVIIAAGSIKSYAVCPLNLADLLDGGTFTGPCSFGPVGAATITGDVNFTGNLTLTGVTTLTVISNFTWVSGLFDIQGSSGNLTVGNGTTGSFSIQSGTVRANDASNGALVVTSNATISIAQTAAIQWYSTLNLNTGGTINNFGAMSNGAGTAQISGTLNLSFNTATYAQVGTLQMNFTSIVSTNVGSTTTVTGSIGLTSGGSLTNNGTMTATSLAVIGGALSNTGTLSSTLGMTISGSLNNSGTTSSSMFNVTSTGSVVVTSTGQINTTGGGDNTINGSLTTQGDLNFSGDLVIDGASGIVTMNGGTIDIFRAGGEGDLEVTDSGSFIMNGGFLNVQDDIVTLVDGNDASIGYFVINGSVTVGDDVNITDGGSFTSTGAPGTATLLMNGAGAVFTDENCAYPSPATTFCNCVPGSTACSSALPITLLSFSGEQSGNMVKLNWVTATEINNDFFSVEKLVPSSDNFQQVTNVQGSGTTLLKRHYEASDNTPQLGNNYYRLKQTDFDKRFSYSDVIRIDFKPVSMFLDIYPNPATSGTGTIQIPGLASRQSISISIHNSLGISVYSIDVTANEFGLLKHEATLSELPKGIYIIQAGVYRKKWVIE